jgi:16S rRNA (cytidine1402-2'-O)-methyltransferase
LTLVATPIGHLADLSPRARDALAAADIILCEDTRVTARLVAAHGISVTTWALHEHNEDAVTPRVLERLARRQRVALVSDAGTPLVSDPGYRIVRATIAAGLPVGAVPGPNAAVMALTLSGLPPMPFMFLGFAPPRAAARRTAFARLCALEGAGLSATLIWHEAPHRLAETLADAATAFGARPAAVARELTKRFEEVRRGTLPELAAHYAAHAARGEITLVVGPAPEAQPDAAALPELLGAALKRLSMREAVDAVASATGLPKRDVYRAALELRSADEAG